MVLHNEFNFGEGFKSLNSTEFNFNTPDIYTIYNIIPNNNLHMPQISQINPICHMSNF